MALVSSAQAAEINPGDVRNFNCSEFCTDGSLEVSCASCPECNVTECGVCSIDATLEWNQTYNNTEEPCDLNIHCQEMNLTQMGIVYFPSRIKVRKDSGNFYLSVDVYNRNGMIENSWNKQISEEDVVEYTYEYNYSCPAELTTNVNMETCAPFLSSYLNVSDPVMLQVFTGSTICMRNLVDCQSKMEARSDVAHLWEQRYNLILDQYNDIEELYNDCYLEMDFNNHEGTLRKTVTAVRQEFSGFVPGVWVWYTGILFVLLVILGVYALFGGGKIV